MEKLRSHFLVLNYSHPHAKLALFISALLWGSSYAFQKTLLVFINPVIFVFWNFFVGAVFFLIIALVKGYKINFRLKEGLLLGIFLSGIEILQTVGLSTSPASNAAFIVNIGMLLIPWTGFIFFRHKISAYDNIALLLSFVGMYFLVGGVHGFKVGDEYLLLSAFSCALYFLFSERFEAEKHSHLVSLLLQQFSVIAIVSFIVATLGDLSFTIPTHLYTPLLLQIFAFNVIPYGIVQWASRFTNEMSAALYDGVIEPLIGGIIAWGIFLEASTPTKVAGGLLMVFAFAFATIFKRKRQ